MQSHVSHAWWGKGKIVLAHKVIRIVQNLEESEMLSSATTILKGTLVGTLSPQGNLIGSLVHKPRTAGHWLFINAESLS